MTLDNARKENMEKLIVATIIVLALIAALLISSVCVNIHGGHIVCVVKMCRCVED